jgi:hypothetical protein
MNKLEYILWVQSMQWSAGPCSLWPPHIRRSFWTTDSLEDWELRDLAVFSWINGIEALTVYNWFDRKSRRFFGSAAHRFLQQVFLDLGRGTHFPVSGWDVKCGKMRCTRVVPLDAPADEYTLKLTR